MVQVNVTLKHGLLIGNDCLKDAVLREVTTGDIIEAGEESEKVVFTAEGYELVSSPTLVGVNVLRRQIVSIGNANGPLDMSLMKALHPQDFNLLQQEANKLEAAAEAETTKAVSKRGRTAPASGGD